MASVAPENRGSSEEVEDSKWNLVGLIKSPLLAFKVLSRSKVGLPWFILVCAEEVS